MLHRLPVAIGAALLVIIFASFFNPPWLLVLPVAALVFLTGLFFDPLTNS